MRTQSLLKSFLKTTAVLVTLVTGNQAWGASVWINPYTAEPALATEVPAKAEVVYYFPAGASQDAVISIEPASASHAKIMTLSLGAQTGAAPSNSATFVPLGACTINLICAEANAEDVLPFTLDNTADVKVIINLLGGRFDLNAAVAGTPANVTVNVVASSTIVAATDALKWQYVVPTGQVLTLDDATVLDAAGSVSGKGRVVTPADASCEIQLK